jgi:hypothetical protein
MAMPWEYFCFVFALVHYGASLCLQQSLAQLYPTAWAGNAGKYSIYFSFISMMLGKVPHLLFIYSFVPTIFLVTNDKTINK